MNATQTSPVTLIWLIGLDEFDTPVLENIGFFVCFGCALFGVF